MYVVCYHNKFTSLFLLILTCPHLPCTTYHHHFFNFQWLDSMLEGLKLPIIPAAVQSVHANAVASAAEAQIVAAQANRSGRGRKQVEDTNNIVNTSTTMQLNDDLNTIPPLGTARSVNKGEVS